MRFFADLHVHSYYSRATSKQGNIDGLYHWASKKGIQVVGTGDFTHPGWLKELEDGLEETEPGLYMPKNAKELDARLPESCRIHPRFLLTVEISSIYKKAGRVRKVHTVILMPDLTSARAFHAALDKIGNVRSDGRPILGLDPKEILKIAKSIHGNCEVIPAHIWTPWFSTLGAKSGFDALEECYEEELHHIHALETGLSSDPTMNYRVSALDKYTLVSNSDAHSPSKLGREANILDTSLSYHAIVQAIRNPSMGFTGTVEFYPEEGKYHFDGHRKCGVVLTPEQAATYGGICPVCKKPLTMGVMHRVLELADREEGRRPYGKPLELHQIPLPEVLGELHGFGPQSKRVQAAYERLLAASGPELPLLLDLPEEGIVEVVPTLIDAIHRIRDGKVYKDPGYDGVFGKIKVFKPGELDSLRAQGVLFTGMDQVVKKEVREHGKAIEDNAKKQAEEQKKSSPAGLTDRQKEAVNCEGNCAVVAGPGTGKTFVLTRRVHELIRRGEDANSILAVTFTTAAAIQIQHRLSELIGGMGPLPNVMTLHAFGLGLAGELWPDRGLIDETDRLLLAKQQMNLTLAEARSYLRGVSLFKAGAGPEPKGFDRYEKALEQAGALDMDDLIWRVVRALDTDDKPLRQRNIRFLLVDEIQDINPAQARMILHIHRAGAAIFVIGDPEQSVYGFRGSMPDAVDFLREKVPEMEVINLEWTFRLTGELAAFAAPLRQDERRFMTSGHGPIPEFLEFRTPIQEAIFIAKEIAGLLGGLDMRDQGHEIIAPEDIAVISRTRRTLDRVREALMTEGVPFVEGSGGKDTGMDAVKIMHAVLKTILKKQSVNTLKNTLTDYGMDDSVPVLQAVDMLATDNPNDSKTIERIWSLVSTGMHKQGIGELPYIKDLSMSVDASSLIDALVLMQSIDALNIHGSGVRLLTIHAAKGLEFKAVFIVGVQDGLMPFERARTRDEMAEERRLFHVAATRSSGRLYMTSVKHRNLPGLEVKEGMSDFLGLVPQDAFTNRNVKTPRKRPTPHEQLELF